MSELPATWLPEKLGELVEFVMGQAPPGAECNKIGDGTPFVKAGEFSEERPIIREWTTRPLKFASANDVLICVVGATAGKINLGADCAIGRSVAAVRPTAALDQHFLHSFLSTKVLELRARSAGSAQGVISKEDLANVVLPLPPLPEQRRIVAKIDSLSTKSKRARDHLDHLPRLVEKYKQAVLAAAFRGELTREWRQKHSHDGQWLTHRLEELIFDGPTNGWSPKSGPDAQGALALKLTATTSGYLRLDDAAVKRIYDTPSPTSACWLKPGDLLVQRSNTIEYVGAAAIFDGPHDTYIYPDLMMRIRIKDDIDRQYVWRFLNSEPARRYFRERATGTAGNMPKINGETLRSLSVLFPPTAEERSEVVRRIETAFAWIDRLASEATSARKLIGHLDHGILAKAFRGELVPQDPADEPASVLLERIRAARSAADPAGTRPRRRNGAQEP